MKYFNVNGKRSSLLAKGITVLSLSVVLQGAEGCRGWNKHGEAKKADPITMSITCSKVEDLPTLVRGYNDDTISTRLNDILYDFVKNRKYNALQSFLDCYKTQKGFKQPTLTKALNAFYPQYNNRTLLGISIENKDKKIFECLLTQQGIDINSTGHSKEKHPTSALLTLAKQQGEMFNTLMAKPSVDIQTVEPISGDTTIHFAIRNNWQEKAKELIKRLLESYAYRVLFTKNKTNEDTILHLSVKHMHENVQKQLIEWIARALLPQSSSSEDLKELVLKFLFECNKDGKTALHSAMKYKQGYIQDKLIELALQHNQKEKLWIKDNKGRSAIDIGILYDQSNVPKLIKELPLEKIDQKLVHTIVSHNKEEVFKAILDRLSVLAKEDKDNVQGKLKELFGSPTAGKKSMWEYIYLSKLSTEPAITGTNIKMFKDAIEVIKSILPQKEWQDIEKVILNKIKEREVTPRIKGGISTQYATKLRNIIKSTSSVPSVPSRPLPDQKEAESTEHSTQLQKAQAG